MISGDSHNLPEFLFPLPSYEDWLKVARQELDGEDPQKKLAIIKGELEILPFYTAAHSVIGKRPLLGPSPQPYHGPRNWANTPKIIVKDEHKANALALHYLNTGAEGILFDCQSTSINPALLLDRISLPDCTVSFLITNASVNWLVEFHRFAEENFDKETIRGCFFWSNPNDLSPKVFHTFSGWKQFYPLGILVKPQENVINEIAQCLTETVHLINEWQNEGIDATTLLSQISFSVHTGTHFFTEIAKLKSLRLLWHQIKRAYNVSGEKPLHLHALSPAWGKNDFQPHGNMIKATTAAMAAIAGGCDSLTVEPEDFDNESLCRIARNISIILREEAQFSRVADPTAGSFYVEALTDQLAQKTWSKFQEMVKS